jgi:hypothetical protein
MPSGEQQTGTVSNKKSPPPLYRYVHRSTPSAVTLAAVSRNAILAVSKVVPLAYRLPSIPAATAAPVPLTVPGGRQRYTHRSVPNVVKLTIAKSIVKPVSEHIPAAYRWSPGPCRIERALPKGGPQQYVQRSMPGAERLSTVKAEPPRVSAAPAAYRLPSRPGANE